MRTMIDKKWSDEASWMIFQFKFVFDSLDLKFHENSFLQDVESFWFDRNEILVFLREFKWSFASEEMYKFWLKFITKPYHFSPHNDYSWQKKMNKLEIIHLQNKKNFLYHGFIAFLFDNIFIFLIFSRAFKPIKCGERTKISLKIRNFSFLFMIIVCCSSWFSLKPEKGKCVIFL